MRGDPYIAFIADMLGGQHMNAITAVRAMGSFGQQVRAVSCNVEEALRLIAANIGIGMVPDHLAAPGLVAGDLWQLPPYDLLPTADVFRISNPNAILNPTEAAFAMSKTPSRSITAPVVNPAYSSLRDYKFERRPPCLYG
ncbi:hypothetical protein [Pararhizobium sp. O133]|uniref:hypothetical protein n=1 Tax=Pararhizobium sp. O133 TaxID=3449278 RepID=UPI003F684B0D